MKLSELSTLGEVIGRQAEDPEFREEWDRSAFAREAAIRLVRCRVERGLTQAQLARSVGLQQSVIARLERGEQPPSLARITAGTGIGLHLDEQRCCDTDWLTSHYQNHVYFDSQVRGGG